MRYCCSYCPNPVLVIQKLIKFGIKESERTMHYYFLTIRTECQPMVYCHSHPCSWLIKKISIIGKKVSFNNYFEPSIFPTQFRDNWTIRYGLLLKICRHNVTDEILNWTWIMLWIFLKEGLLSIGITAQRLQKWYGIQFHMEYTVEMEPILWEAIVSNILTALQADYKVNGIRVSESVSLFDNRIINIYAPSYARQDWLSI